MYGKDWRAMMPLIKTRSLRQIRTHAQKVLKSMYAKRNVPHATQPMEMGDSSTVEGFNAGVNNDVDESNLNRIDADAANC
tara:strand:+ start:2868 stop:3107 length:240 start_codon:yes stop_codon:yes gene_type:complete